MIGVRWKTGNSLSRDVLTIEICECLLRPQPSVAQAMEGLKNGYQNCFRLFFERFLNGVQE